MKFIAKLIALMVVLTFTAAIYFQIEGVVEKVEVPKNKEVDTIRQVEDYEFANVNLPLEFESSTRKLAGLKSVKIASTDEMKKRIYLEQEVLVYVDNSYLKNPFLGVNDKLLISLIGYKNDHLVSTGREIGQDHFIYLAEDFMDAWVRSGAKAWILK